MPCVRKLRPFICVLLAVATVIGTAPAAVKRCGCPGKSRTPVQKTSPPAAPAPFSCDTNAVQSCCASPKKGGRCCCESSQPQPASHNPAPSSGCECLKCECESPTAPPADSVPPAPAPDSGSLQLAAIAFAPPVFLPLPAANHLAPAGISAHPPPTDLVTTLSRRTC